MAPHFGHNLPFARLNARQKAWHIPDSADPAFDTADFLDVPGPGNLRADYVLPDSGQRIEDTFVVRENGVESLCRSGYGMDVRRP